MESFFSVLSVYRSAILPVNHLLTLFANYSAAEAFDAGRRVRTHRSHIKFHWAGRCPRVAFFVTNGGLAPTTGWPRR